MRQDQRGYIVVETIGAFLLLVLLVLSILSLVNIVVVQSRMHYALSQTAQTLSMYSYALEAAGVAEHAMNLAGNAEAAEAQATEFRDNANDMLTALQNFSLSDAQSSGSAMVGQIQDAVADPREMLRLTLNFGLKKGTDELFQVMVKPLILHYLCNGSESGEEFLTAFGVDVDSMEMSDGSWGVSDTTLLDSAGDVKLTVHYQVDYVFGTLPLPFDNKLDITQTVKTKAWLGGHGEGYEE